MSTTCRVAPIAAAWSRWSGGCRGHSILHSVLALACAWSAGAHDVRAAAFQTIAFAPVADQFLGAAPLPLWASASSGLGVTFSSLSPATCAVSGTRLAVVGAGVCTLRAAQPGDAAWAAAAPVDRSLTVRQAAGGSTFSTAVNYAVGMYPDGVATADFDRDGKMDLAVVNWVEGTVSILPGRGDGTFGAPRSQSTGVGPMALAIGDFNGDGKPDVAVSNLLSQDITILLGAGDGSLVHAGTIPVGAALFGIVAGDLDGDGRVDLAVANGTSAGVPGQSVFLFFGKGDGTFQLAGSLPVGAGPVALAMRDVNGDGRQDLVVANADSNDVSVWLGSGNGSFSGGTRYAVDWRPQGIAVGDLNGDGRPDVAVANGWSDSVSVLLNGGNGGYLPAVNYPVGIAPGGLVIADFTGDGKSDIAVLNQLGESISLLRGRGDGTFGAAEAYTVLAQPLAIATADFNGDGKPDLAVAAAQADALSVLLAAGSTGGAASLAPASGTPQSAMVNVAYATPLRAAVADPAGRPVAGVPVTFTAPAAGASGTFASGRTVTVGSGADGVAVAPIFVANATAGTFVVVATVNALSANFALTNLAAAAIAPSFTSGAAPAGVVDAPYAYLLRAAGTPPPVFFVLANALPPGLRLDAVSGAISGSPSTAGTFAGMFTARNGTLPDATQAFAIAIAGAQQSITFAALPDVSIGSAPFPVTATASSGLAVTVTSLTTSVCMVSGSTVTLAAGGSCTLRAAQPGDANHVAAPVVDRTFNVTRLSQSVAFPVLGPQHVGSGPTPFAASASSGLAVNVTSLTPGTCSVRGGQLFPVAVGPCSLRASQAGSSRFLPAANVDQSVPIVAAYQFVSFASPGPRGLGESPLPLSAYASSGLPVLFTSQTPAVCTTSGAQATLLATGTCTIQASQAGNFSFDAAPPVAQSFGVYPAVLASPIPPIAPYIEYVSVFGGSDRDRVFDVAIAPDGTAAVAGSVVSTDFPGLSSSSVTNAGLDLSYVAKLDPRSGALVSSTPIGGRSAKLFDAARSGYTVPDVVEAMAADAAGNVYVAAYGYATDLPVKAGVYALAQGKFVYRLTPAGTVQAIAGPLDAAIATIRALAVDGAGNVYLTGTAGPGLATTPNAAFGPNVQGGPYAIKLSATGAKLYATYLTLRGTRPALAPSPGQSTWDAATTPYAIAVDASGNVVIAGQASASDFAVTPGSPDTSDQRNRDAVVVKLNASGTAVMFVARLGGDDADRATGVAIAPDGAIVIGGKTAHATLQRHVRRFPVAGGVSERRQPRGSRDRLRRDVVCRRQGVDGHRGHRRLGRQPGRLPGSRPVSGEGRRGCGRRHLRHGHDLSEPHAADRAQCRWCRGLRRVRDEDEPRPQCPRLFHGARVRRCEWRRHRYLRERLRRRIRATSVRRQGERESWAAGAERRYRRPESGPDGRPARDPRRCAVHGKRGISRRHDDPRDRCRGEWRGNLAGQPRRGRASPGGDVFGHRTIRQRQHRRMDPGRHAGDGAGAMNAGSRSPQGRRIGQRRNTGRAVRRDSPGRRDGLDECFIVRRRLASNRVPAVHRAPRLPVSGIGWLAIVAWLWTSALNAAVPHPPIATLVVPERTVTYIAPASPVLYATARYDVAPAPATVVRVEFYDGDALIGAVAASNAVNGGYALVWSNVPAGPHAVTARAVDSLGANGVSASVMVHVVPARVAPQVALTAPVSGALYPPVSTVALAATATSTQGSIQRVEFRAGEAIVATALAPPFIGMWVNPQPGEYAVHARAFDEVGTVAASGVVRVQILREPRAIGVVLTSPVDGASVVAGNALLVEASALAPDDAIARVDFYHASTKIGSTASAPYQTTWASPTVGSIALTAKAYDTAGRSASSAAVVLTATAPAVPTVALTSPVGGSTFIAPDAIPLAATAARPGGSIGKVEFFDGLALIGSTTQAPYAYAWTGGAVGAHSLSARATDHLGATATSAPVAITIVANRPPAVALSAPAAGSVFVAGQSILIAATASDPDGPVSKVEFLDGAAVLGSASASPYTFQWTAATVGAHALSARATDSRGASTTSATRSIQVVTDATPTISVTAPATGTAYAQGQAVGLGARATVPGKTIAQVEFYGDGNLLGKVAFGGASTATATLSWKGATLGTHVIVARVVANDGTVASSPPVSIEVRDLSVELFEPRPGQVYLSPAAVRITALAAETAHGISRVDILNGTQVIASLTGPPFVFDWKDVVPGTYALSARTVDSAGLVATSPAVSVRVVANATVALDSGIDASTVADDSVSVSGTVLAPPNSAVSVNGRLGIVDGQGRFFVNGVPLGTGSNPLLLKLLLENGTEIGGTFGVNSTGPAPFTVDVDREEGTAPLDATVTITNRGKVPFSRIDIDVDDNGKPERTVTSLVDGKVSMVLTYNAVGTYVLRVTAYDAANNVVYLARRKLYVYDPKALAARVGSVYTNMLRRLAAGDTSGALNAITPTMRDAYRDIFGRLGSSLPAAVQQLGGISEISMGSDFADILVTRQKADGAYGYHVLLIRDDDGIWRIEGM